MRIGTLLRACAFVPVVCLAAHASTAGETPAETAPAQTGVEKAQETALAWVESLATAEQVDIESYVRETHLRSGNVFHQYARGAYTEEGFALEVWTPEQHERGDWSVDERLMLVAEQPAEHTMELAGEEVYETILADRETGAREEFRYHRLDPLREELVASLRRMASLEAKEAQLPAEEWPAYTERRVREVLPEALEEASSGIPLSRARRFAKCLTGDMQARYQGDGCMVESHRAYVLEGEWSPEPALRNGLLCYAVVHDYDRHTHTLWYNEDAGLVCWETTQFALDQAPDEPEREPRVVREHFYRFAVTPPAAERSKRAALD